MLNKICNKKVPDIESGKLKYDIWKFIQDNIKNIREDVQLMLYGTTMIYFDMVKFISYPL